METSNSPENFESMKDLHLIQISNICATNEKGFLLKDELKRHLEDVHKENICSSLLTPEGMDSSENKTCRGRTFHFPRSTGQLSAERSKARQS